jgi:hypothetical protein
MGAPFGATGSEVFAGAAGAAGGEAGAAAVVTAAAADVESAFVVDGPRVGARTARPATAGAALGSAEGVTDAAVDAGVGSAVTVGAGAEGAGDADATAALGGGAAADAGTFLDVFAARTRTTAAMAVSAIDTTTPAARPFANERGRSTARPRSEL